MLSNSRVVEPGFALVEFFINLRMPLICSGKGLGLKGSKVVRSLLSESLDKYVSNMVPNTSPP